MPADVLVVFGGTVVGSATRLSDGRLKLRQGSIGVGEGDWSRPKEERSEASGQEDSAA